MGFLSLVVETGAIGKRNVEHGSVGIREHPRGSGDEDA